MAPEKVQTSIFAHELEQLYFMMQQLLMTTTEDWALKCKSLLPKSMREYCQVLNYISFETPPSTPRKSAVNN